MRVARPAAAPMLPRQELEKLNLALEMGNNVMYLDDIQHRVFAEVYLTV